MSYVRKYELGELGLDLAYANCIYELPLLSFGDIHNSVNLSLVFNQQMKETGSNPFNIAQGYKFNLQKRIIFEDDDVFFQDTNGKKIRLYSYDGGYTFDDDSQRIIRIGATYYTLEHPDFSTERYELNGRIKSVYDKYGYAVLTYKYENNLLTEIAFREEGTTSSKKISFVYNSASQIYSITYSGNSTVQTLFNYYTDYVLVSHYSGVNYGLSSSGKNFVANISSTEDSTTYSYAKKCIIDADNNTFTVSDLVDMEEVNITTYKYPDLTGTPNDACDYVEITDYLGVKTRVQFNSGKTTYSYEISENDVEFKNDSQYMGNVNVFRTEDDLYNAQTPYVQSYHSGVNLTVNENGQYSFLLSSLGLNSGYYIISGWLKVKDDYEKSTSNIIQIMSSLSVCEASYFVSGVTKGKWMYFAIKANFSSNTLYVVFEDNAGLEIRDLRLTFKPTHIWSGLKSNILPVAEDVLIHRTSGNSVELRNLFISATAYNPEIDWISFDDILRYTVNQKRGDNTSEFYCSKSKTVVSVNSSEGVILKRQNGDSVETFNLDDYYLGKRSYSSRGIVTTQVISDDITCFLYYETVSETGEKLVSKTYNSDLDVIAETYGKLVTTYTRNQDLVTSTSISTEDNSIAPFYTSTAYDEANGIITQTDEHGKITKYTVDLTWGVILKVELPDGTVITDAYDDDKGALLSKSFANGQVSKINEFGYSGGSVSSITGGDLGYTFEYTKGDLTKVRKNGSPIEEHAYTPTQITSYYPYGYNEENEYKALYSIIRNYDKYGRLSSVNNILTNAYSVYPDFNESTGELIESTHADNADGRLAIMTDSLTSEVSRYKYTDEGQISERTVTKTNFETKVSSENFAYDAFQRLTSHTFEYDTDSSSSIGDTITYVKPVTDPSADSLVYSHRYNVNGVRHAYTYNNYDALKRLTGKHVALTSQNVYYNRTIQYNKTRVNSVTDKFSGVDICENFYYYDDVGRITANSIYNMGAPVYKSYAYDIYGQLVRENNSALDKTYVYEYNGIGNVTAIKSYPYTTGELTGTPGTTSFGYTNDKLTSFGSKAITYNANGEVASYNGWNYTWKKGKLNTVRMEYGASARIPDGLIKPTLKNSKTYTFTYNALGQRVKSSYSHLFNTSSIIPVTQGEVTDYTRTYSYDNLGRLVSESITETLYAVGTVSSEIVFLYDESSVIGMVYTSGGTSNTYYYLKNLQGDVVGIYNTTGTMLVRYSYDAWGNCTIASGTTDQVIAKVNPIRYRGYYYDVDTGLYYLNARYYNPEWRRFISPDDTAYLDPETPNGLNLYCYCNNDPVNYADPSGHLPEWAWKIIIGTAFILGGALVTAVTAGTGTAFWAAFGSALLTSTIQVGISTAVSAGLGFIGGGLSTGTWEGAFTGMIEGAVDGYMWGGIISGGSQILSGLMKAGRGISAGRVDALYKSENSTTLFNYNNAAGKSRFRIDVAKGKVKYPSGKTGFLSGKELNGLHYHFGKSNSLRNLHRFFTPGIVNGFISSGLGYFF